MDYSVAYAAQPRPRLTSRGRSKQAAAQSQIPRLRSGQQAQANPGNWLKHKLAMMEILFLAAVEPKDTKLMVDFTNKLVAAIKHPIAWVHMPVPREREDVAAYFAPLKGLKIDPRTELYLELVHRTDGVAGARRRLAAAEEVVTNFGVAAECGFGRRPPETVPDLIELHREVARAG